MNGTKPLRFAKSLTTSNSTTRQKQRAASFQTFGRLTFLILATALACWNPNGRCAAQDLVAEPQVATTEAPVATPAVLPRPEIRVAARDRQFAKLAEEVAGLEKYYAILNQAARLTRPSVVHIEAEKRSSDPEHKSLSGGIAYVEEAGSGVVAKIKGKTYVLTNRHVISGAELTGLRLELSDGRRLKPTEKWADPATDVAVIAIENKDTIPARIGRSNKVNVGDAVLAFGSPFGLNHSVTQGIISAKGRRDLQLGEQTVEIQDFMQTDAAINPGNSGGPLFNLRGELIGINTAIASNSGGNEGIGFTIPIDLAMTVAQQLVENGKMVRGYLGVKLNAKFTRSEATKMGVTTRQLGAHVTRASAGSPAENGGIKKGDVIVSFGSTPVEDDGHLVNLVGLTPVNSVVPIHLIRDGEPMTVEVELSPRDH